MRRIHRYVQREQNTAPDHRTGQPPGYLTHSDFQARKNPSASTLFPINLGKKNLIRSNFVRDERRRHRKMGNGALPSRNKGPKEALTKVSLTVLVYIWAKDHTENWSAFVPDFKELKENEEYVEREDEFDLLPQIEEASKS